MTRLPFLRQWFRTSRAVVMHLTNGTLQVTQKAQSMSFSCLTFFLNYAQVNYFKDHVKLILCPLMGAVTVINDRKQHRTFKLTSLAEYGCSSDLMQRLEYVSEKINFLLAPKSQLNAIRTKQKNKIHSKCSVIDDDLYMATLNSLLPFSFFFTIFKIVVLNCHSRLSPLHWLDRRLYSIRMFYSIINLAFLFKQYKLGVTKLLKA